MSELRLPYGGKLRQSNTHRSNYSSPAELSLSSSWCDIEGNWHEISCFAHSMSNIFKLLVALRVDQK